jgi:acyl-CoA hydrolase
MNWRKRYVDKLMSPEDAFSIVRSGDRVFAAMFTSTPPALCRALFARHAELRDVTNFHYIAPFVWATPETRESFRLRTVFAGAADRQALPRRARRLRTRRELPAVVD